MGSPNVGKIFIMLEEAGIDYNFVRVDIIAGDQFSQEFRELNPNCKVPVLVDERDSEKPIVLFESGVILQYLSDISGVLKSKNLVDHYEVQKWLTFQMASVGPMFGQAIHFNFVVRDPSYAQKRFSKEFFRLLSVIEKRLSVTEYIAGDFYSIADIAIFSWIRTAIVYYPQVKDYSKIIGWYQKIMQREAVKKAMDVWIPESKVDIKNISVAKADQLDRYFGR